MKIDTESKTVTYSEKEEEIRALTEEIMDEGHGLALSARWAINGTLPRHRRVPPMEGHDRPVEPPDPDFVYVLSAGTLRLVDGIIRQTAPWGGE